MSALATALEALVSGIQTYKVKVPDSPVFPYVLLNASLPSPNDRALSRDGQTVTGRIRATVVGFDAVSVRWGCGKVMDSLEGARPTVTGWNVGRVENVPNDQPMLIDTDVFITNRGHPVYQPLDFLVIASQLPQ